MSNISNRRQTTKHYSRSQVALAVRKYGPISRTRLSEISGLSQAWVSRIVDELVMEGVLVETTLVPGTRGRPKVLLDINPNGTPVAGVSLAPESAEIAVATPTGALLARRSVPYDRHSVGVEATVAAIARAVQRCAESAGLTAALAGVGVSVAGWVDPVLGVIERMGNRRGWEGVPVARLLEDTLAVPVYVENDVRAGALASRWLGRDGTDGETLYVYVSTGIGAAFLDDRQMLRGAHNAGGLLSHVVVDLERQGGGDSRHGSLEDFASDVAFLRAVWPDMKSDAGEMTTAEHVSLVRRGYALAQEGDEKAVSALFAVTHYLGVAVANAISMMDPRTVFICGTLVDIAPQRIVDMIRQEVRPYIYHHAQAVRIEPLTDSEQFLLRGAIGLALCQPYKAANLNGLALPTV